MRNSLPETDEAEIATPKERIFCAAMSIALRNGFGKVTLNLIAREAGFSKGGLLYHFATKDELIGAMLDHYRLPTLDPIGPDGDDMPPARSPKPEAFALAVLIAAAENPALLEPVRALLQSHSLQSSGSCEKAQNLLPLIGGLVERFNFGRGKKIPRIGAVHGSDI